MSGTIPLDGSEPDTLEGESHLDFAITEGLELLALYRQIDNSDVRASIIEFLRNFVAATA